MVSGLVGGMAGGTAVTIVIQAVDKFSSVFAGVNKKMLITGGVITAMGVAGIAVSKNLVDSAASFESAFTGVKKTVELTAAEFDQLKRRFVDLSKEVPITFEELSRIGEIAGQLGVEGVDNIAKFTKTIADISVTTNLTAEEAATSFARIANVMGEPIENVDRMGSAIVDLGNNFATSEQEIVDMAMRIMGAGNTIGLSTQEVFGMSAALSSLGIRSEMGGSAMSRAMITIAKSVAEGSDELESYAEVSGMTVDAFSEAWKTKPVDAMSQVVLGLKNISDSGGNTFGVLEDLDLKSIRITDTMLRLSGSEGGLTDTVDRSKIAWEKNIALVEEANKRYDTTESQVQMMKNKFTALKVQMGERLIPTFQRLVDILGDTFEWLEQHPTLTKFAVAALAIGSALAIIVGPLLIIVAMLPAMSAGFGMIATGMGAVSAASIPFLVAMAPVLAILVGIAAAIALAYSLYKLLMIALGKDVSGPNLEDQQDEFDRMNGNEVGTSSGKRKSKNDSTIHLNNKPLNSDVIALNDFIVTPSGKIIKPSPQDTLIGTKHPENLGNGQGVTLIINGNVTGTDPDDMAEAFATKLDRVIRL